MTVPDIDFTMVIPAGVAVRGRVVGLSNQSVAGIQRIMLTGMGNPAQDTVIKADGSFEFLKVRPGTYNVLVLAPGAMMQPLSIAVSDKDISGIDVTIMAATIVAGRLVVDGGGTRPRVTI